MTPHSRTEDELRAAMRDGEWEVVAGLASVLDALSAPPPAPRYVSAALWYAEQGLHVFPLQPLAKVPWPRSRGFKDATTDADRIRAWWDAAPEANIGIATGHVIDVLDFDGPQAHAAWGKRIGQGWGGERVLGSCSTPRSGGLHVYLPTKARRNRASFLPGVDLRGLGGYVVAPPSQLDDRDDQHPGTYRFLRPLRPQGPPYD